MTRRPAPGVRQRKRALVREALVAAAFRLFHNRGFDAVSVTDVAEAAGVSRRSFFRYFPTKEDVVFAWQDGLGEEMARLAAERPEGEPPLVTLRHAVVGVVGRYKRQEALALAQLIVDTPSLRQHNYEKYATLERMLAEVIATRMGVDAGQDMRPRFYAVIAAGAMRVGVDAWSVAGRPGEPAVFVERAFEGL